MFLGPVVSPAPGVRMYGHVRQNHVPICSISDGHTAANVPVAHQGQGPTTNSWQGTVPTSDGTLLVALVVVAVVVVVLMLQI